MPPRKPRPPTFGPYTVDDLRFYYDESIDLAYLPDEPLTARQESDRFRDALERAHQLIEALTAINLIQPTERSAA